MTDRKNPERTAGGTVGKLVGRAKEAAGSVLDNEELAREGRLQRAGAEADQEAAERTDEAKQREAEAELQKEEVETKAERDRLRNELETQERQQAAERDRREAEKKPRSGPRGDRGERGEAASRAVAIRSSREAGRGGAPFGGSEDNPARARGSPRRGDRG